MRQATALMVQGRTSDAGKTTLVAGLARVLARRGVRVVFSLHDYWLMCPRGQFMQTFPVEEAPLWAACDGQQDAIVVAQDQDLLGPFPRGQSGVGDGFFQQFGRRHCWSPLNAKRMRAKACCRIMLL